MVGAAPAGAAGEAAPLLCGGGPRAASWYGSGPAAGLRRLLSPWGCQSSAAGLEGCSLPLCTKPRWLEQRRPAASPMVKLFSTAEASRRVREAKKRRQRAGVFVRVAVSARPERGIATRLYRAIGLPEAVNDPHAVRRLRHRAWPNFGQEMRSLQHALLRSRMPGAALERRRPRPALQENKKSRRRRAV